MNFNRIFAIFAAAIAFALSGTVYAQDEKPILFMNGYDS